MNLIENLLNETDFIPYLLESLWNRLSDQYDNECHLTATRLLLMVHSVFPSDICDQRLSQLLAMDQNEELKIDEFERFFRFWNLIRDQTLLQSTISMKPFEQSVISVLLNLEKSNSRNLKSMVERWICDRFRYGKKEKFLHSFEFYLFQATPIESSTFCFVFFFI